MMFKHIFEKRQLAKKLQQLLPFSTHQIYLGNGLWTMDKGVIAEKDLRTKVVLDQAGGSLRGKTILDLGCLEGGFTVAFARLGAKMSVGVEAREISYQRCEILRQYLKLRNLRFIHGDINVVLPQLQPFNIVFASGILYQMADPYSLLKAIHAVCRDFAVIDTHIAQHDSPSHKCSAELVTRTFEGKTYVGRIYHEYDPCLPKDQVEGFLWAAYRDHDAFWPLEKSLEQMLLVVGFHNIIKIYPSSELWQVDHKNRILLVVTIS